MKANSTGLMTSAIKNGIKIPTLSIIGCTSSGGLRFPSRVAAPLIAGGERVVLAPALQC
jgi:hypothetical protein